MALSAAQITQRFDAFVSRPLLEAILKCIFDAYRTAYEECERIFDKPELKNVLPYYRLGKLNAALRAIPESLGVKATAELNSACNHYHVLLIAGGARMTASSVECAGQLPRHAIFRETYAQESQLHLFYSNDPPKEDIPLYGLILHVPDESQKQPVSVQVRFPDKAYKNCVGEPVDLFKRFPDVVASLQITSAEPVVSEPSVKPRRADKKHKSA